MAAINSRVHAIVLVIGLVVVHCMAPGVARPQSPPTWRLEEEWRKGGAADGPYFFDKVRGLAPLPNGRILVFDGAALSFHILGPDGGVVKSFGRRGSGPGEYEQPIMGFATAPDGRILVNDLNNGRLALLSVIGDVIKYVRVSRKGPGEFGMEWDGSFDRTGRFYESVGIRGTVKPSGSSRPVAGDSALMTERWTSDFARADSAPVCGAPLPTAANAAQHYRRESVVQLDGGRTARRSTDWLIPFTEQAVTFVRDLDGLIWSPAMPGSNALQRRESGKCAAPMATTRLAGNRARVPDSLYKARSAASWAEMRFRIPHEYPWFNSLRVDDRNQLWVEREVDGGRRFDVFTSAGRQVRTLAIPDRAARDLPMLVAHDHLYAFVRNRDDVVFLVAWRIAGT